MEAEEIVEKESKGNGQEKKKMTKEKHEKKPREHGQCVTKNQYDLMSHIVPKKN